MIFQNKLIQNISIGWRDFYFLQNTWNLSGVSPVNKCKPVETRIYNINYRRNKMNKAKSIIMSLSAAVAVTAFMLLVSMPPQVKAEDDHSMHQGQALLSTSLKV